MNTMALTFDTLQYAKKLQKAGVTEEQAEIQVELLQQQNNAFNDWIDNNLVTKQDLKQGLEILENRVNNHFNELNNRINELNNRITEMGYQITIRLGGMIAAAVLILGVLIPIIAKFFK